MLAPAPPPPPSAVTAALHTPALWCGTSRFVNCTIPRTPPTSKADAEWLLLQDHRGSSCDGSFVTLITTDSYMEAAVCLRKQLRLVKSICDIVLVYDDAALSAASVATLQSAFDAMVPLTSLVNRSHAQIARARQESLSVRGKAFAGRLTGEGRGGGLAAQSMLKVWLYALPASRFPLVCFLDLDLLITTSIDHLLHESVLSDGGVEMHLAAVPATGCASGRNIFNSALLCFRPSLTRLEALLRRERSYDRLGQACENGFTDQSLLNAEFRGGCTNYRVPHACANVRWRRLPLSYNVNVGLLARIPEPMWAGASVAVVHFAGHYAKPWNPLPKLGVNVGHERRETLRREGTFRERWRQACAG